MLKWTRDSARVGLKILEIVAVGEPKGPPPVASGQCFPAELSPSQLQGPSLNRASSASRALLQPGALSPG